MKKLLVGILVVLVFVAAVGGVVIFTSRESATIAVEQGYGPNPTLPEPNPKLIPTVNIAEASSWPDGAKPTAGSGMQVNEFAGGLDHPRTVRILPNGDVLVAETNAPPKPDDTDGIKGRIMSLVMGAAGANAPSPNRILLLRDADGDGVAEMRTTLIEGLTSPFGMVLVKDRLYVANTDGVVAFPYKEGDTRIAAPAERIADLPAGTINHHWTKDLTASPDGTKLYATVGSNSNVGENGIAAEEGRAAVMEIDLATKASRIFASGLRNPNGPSFNPVTGELWVAVNERDEIGSDLVPDYMTSVRDGAFYGWPYSYYGQHVDVRVDPQNPELVARAVVPDYALGPHTASLGLTFDTGALFGDKYRNGAFVGQHGSWNRKPRSGYKVIFVPFADGKPAGAPQDILTGFIGGDDKALGRPVGVAIDGKGALLVADDVGNKIWRVTPSAQAASN